MTDDAAIAAFHRRCRDGLLAARAARGEWRGRLSSSALSTAVAAFARVMRDRLAPAARGFR